VQFDAEKLLQSYQNQLAKSKFTQAQQASMLDELKAGVYGYTYFED
jgi:arginine decarboxylase